MYGEGEEGVNIGIKLNIADQRTDFAEAFMQRVYGGKVSAHVFILHVMGCLKLAEQVLFELSAFVAMDQGEFLPQSCGSLLPLDLQEGGIVHGIVDQLADLCFLLLSRVNGGLVLVKSFLQEGIRVVIFEVELLLNNSRWFKRGPNQMMMEPSSSSSIEDPLMIG